MATVYIQKRKRKSRNSYVIYFKDPLSGQNTYYKTFRRQKDAQQAANDLRSLLDTGKISEVNKAKGRLNFLSFKKVGHLLVAKWKRRLADGELVQKTFDEYVRRLEHIGEEFGDRPLCEIPEDSILGYRGGLAEKISKVTSNRSLFVIKQVFKHGLKVGAITDDPASSIGYLSEKDHERNAFLLPPFLEKLVKASQKTRAKFYLPALIYLGAEHGASKQEALDLKWSDIDFDFGGKGIIRLFRTKNKMERTEYLMPRTKEALLKWREHLTYNRKRSKVQEIKSDKVFCRIDGTPIKRFDSAWTTAKKISDIHNFHFHDLRHTFCSNARLAGADLKDVKDMIGHRDLSMTDRYSHITPARKTLLQEALAKHYINGAKS